MWRPVACAGLWMKHARPFRGFTPITRATATRRARCGLWSRRSGIARSGAPGKPAQHRVQIFLSFQRENTVTGSRSKGMFTVSVEYGPSMVLIACSGPATVTEICGALWFGGEIARRDKRPRFLFDLLAVEFDGTDEDR